MTNWEASFLGIVLGAFLSPAVEELKHRAALSRETRFATGSLYAELAFLQRRLGKVVGDMDEPGQIRTLRDTRMSALGYFTDKGLPVILRMKENLAITNLRPLLEETLNVNSPLPARIASAKLTLSLIDYYVQARVLEPGLMEKARARVRADALEREKWFREAQEREQANAYRKHL